MEWSADSLVRACEWPRCCPASEIPKVRGQGCPRSIPCDFSLSSLGGEGRGEEVVVPDKAIILNAAAMQRALTRIGHEIAERNESGSRVVLVGIQRGGVPLARRLGSILSSIWGSTIPTGSLDVSMHRDDLDRRAAPTVL